MIYFKLIARCGLFLTILLLWLTLPVSAANRAEIVDITLDRDRGALLASFRIKGCFTPKMEEAIKTGVLTTFRILVVVEKRDLPFRSQVLDRTVEHTIKYDLLQNEYQVQVPEHPDRILRTRDFEQAKRWMSTVTRLNLIPLSRLEQGQSYELRLKAELSKIQLPLFLRYIFFFVSLWDFETDWQKMDFTL